MVQNDSIISIKGKTTLQNQVLYTVPLGRTCIILDWFINNNTDDFVTVKVTMGGVGMIPGTLATPHSKYSEVHCSINLLPGDTIEIQSSSTELEYFFSGVEQDIDLY